jgi:hypothetical protein
MEIENPTSKDMMKVLYFQRLNFYFPANTNKRKLIL